MKGKMLTIGLALLVGATFTGQKMLPLPHVQHIARSSVVAQGQVVESSVREITISPTSTPAMTPETVELGADEPSQSVIMQYVDEQFASVGANTSIINCIITHESGWNPYAVNPGYDNWDHLPDIGLMQIHDDDGTPKSLLFDYKYNVARGIAKFVSAEKAWGNGYHPWSTRFECGVYIN